MKIIVDAMGGDNAPLEIVKGALQAQKRFGLLYNSFYFVAHTHSPNCGPKTGFKTCNPRCLADSAGCD